MSLPSAGLDEESVKIPEPLAVTDRQIADLGFAAELEQQRTLPRLPIERFSLTNHRQPFLRHKLGRSLGWKLSGVRRVEFNEAADRIEYGQRLPMRLRFQFQVLKYRRRLATQIAESTYHPFEPLGRLVAR